MNITVKASTRLCITQTPIERLILVITLKEHMRNEEMRRTYIEDSIEGIVNEKESCIRHQTQVNTGWFYSDLTKENLVEINIVCEIT